MRFILTIFFITLINLTYSASSTKFSYKKVYSTRVNASSDWSESKTVESLYIIEHQTDDGIFESMYSITSDNHMYTFLKMSTRSYYLATSKAGGEQYSVVKGSNYIRFISDTKKITYYTSTVNASKKITAHKCTSFFSPSKKYISIKNGQLTPSSKVQKTPYIIKHTVIPNYNETYTFISPKGKFSLTKKTSEELWSLEDTPGISLYAIKVYTNSIVVFDLSQEKDFQSGYEYSLIP